MLLLKKVIQFILFNEIEMLIESDVDNKANMFGMNIAIRCALICFHSFYRNVQGYYSEISLSSQAVVENY